MKLKVTHTPLHGAWGRIEEVERMAREAAEKTTQDYYEIVLNSIIDLEKLKIKPVLFTDINCKIEVIENKGVNISGSSDRVSIMDLNLGDKIDLYLDITDNIENWSIELVRE